MDIWRARSVAASVGGMSSALLLAEAEEATRCFLERHLTQDGFEVVEAENGEALDLLERARPDLLLVGDPEGPELCRRLREGEPGRSSVRRSRTQSTASAPSSAAATTTYLDLSTTTSSSPASVPSCAVPRRPRRSGSRRGRSRSTTLRGA